MRMVDVSSVVHVLDDVEVALEEQEDGAPDEEDCRSARTRPRKYGAARAADRVGPRHCEGRPARLQSRAGRSERAVAPQRRRRAVHLRRRKPRHPPCCNASIGGGGHAARRRGGPIRYDLPSPRGKYASQFLREGDRDERSAERQSPAHFSSCRSVSPAAQRRSGGASPRPGRGARRRCPSRAHSATLAPEHEERERPGYSGQGR